MKKTFKVLALVLVLLPIAFLSGCNDSSTYIKYNDAISKLEAAGYTVTEFNDEQAINAEILSIVTAYNNAIIVKNEEYEEMGEEYRIPPYSTNNIKMDKMIYANKGTSYAYIFYTKDEASSDAISSCVEMLLESYFSITGPIYGGTDGKFVFEYSYEVDDILKLAS